MKPCLQGISGAQPGAKAALAEIYNAEDKTHAQAAAMAFAAE
jgi:putative transposase